MSRQAIARPIVSEPSCAGASSHEDRRRDAAGSRHAVESRRSHAATFRKEIHTMHRILANRPARAALSTTALAAAILGLPATAVADPVVVSAGSWQNAGLVTRVHPGDAGSWFGFSTAVQFAIAACQSNTFGYMFDATSPSTSRNYATLLMAYSTGKPVAIHFTGTCATGTNRPVVDTIEITDVPYY